MTALLRLPECDMVAHLVLRGQTARWNERVIAGIQHQCWHLDARQAWLCTCPVPVIIRASKAMQGCREHIVKCIQSSGGHEFLRIKQTWELLKLLHGPWFHGG